MAYLLIDDGFAEHEKLDWLSDKDFRAHVRVMCWCSRRENGGHVPPQSLETVRVSKAQVARLVLAELWEVNGNGWVIHDWITFNPPAKSEPEAREKWFAARRQQRRRDRDSDRDESVTGP